MKPSGVARQLVTFCCLAKKKVTQDKEVAVKANMRSMLCHSQNAPPVYRPCGVPSKNHNQAELRNSHCVLRQSSPTPPHDCDFSRRRTGEGRSKTKPQAKQCARSAHQTKKSKNVWEIPTLVRLKGSVPFIRPSTRKNNRQLAVRNNHLLYDCRPDPKIGCASCESG